MERRGKEVLAHISHPRYHGVSSEPTTSAEIEDDMYFGNEYEFKLEPKKHHIHLHQQHSKNKHLSEFAQTLIDEYRKLVLASPRRESMEHAVDILNLVDDEVAAPKPPKDRYNSWNLRDEPAMDEKKFPPWGIELISPILKPSSFRAVLKPMWNFLDTHYHIIAEPGVNSTHVHVSKKSTYTIEEAQRVAIAIIHWEPAWLAIVPVEWQTDSLLRSIYLENFARYKGWTRARVIREIEAKKKSGDLINLLQPDGEKFWSWNFLNLKKSCRTIEFRLGDGCFCLADAEMWSAAAVSFIMAAMKAESSSAITATKCTVPNLESFMLGARSPFHEHEIKRLFDGGKRERKTVAPKFYEDNYVDPPSTAERAKVMALIKDDAGH